MKILFFSDVHGSPESLDYLQRRIEAFQPELLVLLGDVLYHGPRNPLRPDYAPQTVVTLLNAWREKIIAVRGNCDCEVDQMLLAFPILADYSTLFADGRRFFLTHGHLWNEQNLPPIPAGTVLTHGHTHIPVLKKLDNGILIFNPGSTSLPKQNFPPSYGTWEQGKLAVRQLLTGDVLDGLQLSL